jgi:hypothetical protein
VSARSIFAIERLVRQRPWSRITSSGALKAGEEIATVAMKIKILKNIQTVKPFWLNRTANAKQSWFSKSKKPGKTARPLR